MLQGTILLGPLQMALFKIELIYKGASIWTTFIGFEVQLWAKKYGINCGLIAKISGTHIGNLGKTLGTLLGAWWEHRDPKKMEPSTPFPKGKRKCI